MRVRSSVLGSDPSSRTFSHLASGTHTPAPSRLSWRAVLQRSVDREADVIEIHSDSTTPEPVIKGRQAPSSCDDVWGRSEHCSAAA